MFHLPPLQGSPSAIDRARESSQPAGIPYSHFQRHFVSADGDCLFRAVHMGLHGVGSRASTEAIRELRDRLSAYIEQHRFELEIRPAFGPHMVQQLQTLVPQLGVWNKDAGDFVAPLLAQVLGQNIVILEALPESKQYKIKQNLPANSAELPQGNVNNMRPPIYLAHVGDGTHYEYLEPLTANIHSLIEQQTQGNAGQPTQQHASPHHNTHLASTPGSHLVLPPSPSISTTSMDSDRPRKKAKGKGKATIKTELNSPSSTETARIKKSPLLIPFSKTKRLDTHCYIDLSRAAINLTKEGSEESIPVHLIPNANIQTMSALPIVQSPEDPTRPHSLLPQPHSINRNMALQQGRHPSDAVYSARETMDYLLQHPEQRKAHECQSFKLAKIRAINLPNRLTHPTVGMRGVIAAEALSKGTPLHYSGQYLDQQEYQKTIQALSQELQTKAHMGETQASAEAKRLIAAYLWEGITYQGKPYDISSFGAGNTAAMVNHDQHNPNMGVAYMSTYDTRGEPAPQIVVYFALRDIAKNEQLLIDYGENYRFDTPAEGSISVETPGVDTAISPAMGQAIAALRSVKEEASALAASGLIELSRQSHSEIADRPSNSPASLHSPRKITMTPRQQSACETFKQAADKKLSCEIKRRDARQNAAFFFSQDALPEKIKKSSMSHILLGILQKNKAGSLYKFRQSWPQLSQLQPRIPPEQLLAVSNNAGGNITLDYLRENWPILNSLQPHIPTEMLLKIASHNGGRVVLHYLKEHWRQLNDLKPAISPAKLLDTANHNGGSLTLDHLLQHWPALNRLQPSIPANKLLAIANNAGSSNTLNYLREHWPALTQLQPPIPPEQLADIANHEGSSETLRYIRENWTTLTQLTQAIPPPILAQRLADIANHNGGAIALRHLQENWSALTQLQPTITAAQLLDIANHDGGSLALKYLEHHWATLSGFTDRDGKQISIEQLWQISNRKAATRALEVLVKNPHIRTLKMDDIIYLLINDHRRAQFVKKHPHT